MAWPKENLEENLKFMADSLGPAKNEQPRDTIRRYLATGFYKDHLRWYKRRPIYWLFSSGKQRAFQCLVYLHRYHEGTLARMRTEYVIPLHGKIAARIEQLRATRPRRPRPRMAANSRRNRMTQEAAGRTSSAFDEKLKHSADMRIRLDLDDGVKVNYGKFGDLLAKVRAVCGSKGRRLNERPDEPCPVRGKETTMSTTITVEEAQATLKELIHRLTPGEEVVITENQRPVAKLVSEQPQKPGQRPPPGLGKGMITFIAPDFDAPWRT